MSELSVKPATRLEPSLAWTVLTDAPLQGLALAREPGLILAWDEADQLYLLDSHGERRSASRTPDKVLAGAISDSGTLVALLCKGPRLVLLSADLEPLVQRSAPSDPIALAIDPHGRYVAISSRLNVTQFFNRHGKPAGKLETQQPMAHLCFVPSQPFLLATGAYGMILGAELTAASGGSLQAEVVWQQALMSNVGRLTSTGDGGMVLVSCFTHGVQRYDLRGHNEGSYHLGGTAASAVPDFAGRNIAVSTSEGELAVLNSAGNVRWKTALPRSAKALELDGLGRYLVYGLPTGEITRIDLEGGSPRKAAPLPRAAHSPASQGTAGPVRTPSWSAPVATSDEQAETAVLAVLDDPCRIAFMSGRNRMQIFSATGKNLGQGPELSGVGRYLKTAPGWIAAATDRQVALYDARRNAIYRLDLTLAELTHLVPRPETYGLVLVQERDRIGRATPAGRWIWKKELKWPIEEVVIGPGGSIAVTTENGQLLVFDAAGEPAGRFVAHDSEALGLVEAPTAPSDNLAWITLARRFQTLLGHDIQGRVVWETPLPWEAWQMHRIGPFVVITSADGRAQAYDAAGHLHAQSRDAEPVATYFLGPDGDVWRIAAQGVHLICTNLEGEVTWRAVAEGAIGPLAAAASGVAVTIGRSLAWFPANERS